jgi:hypothetical protein
MPRILRVVDADGNLVGTGDSPEAIEGVLERLRQGRFHIDETSSDPLPSGHTSRRWGIAIKDKDGTIAIEPDPWTES